MVVFLRNVFQGPKGPQAWNNIFKDQQNHNNNLGYLKNIFQELIVLKKRYNSGFLRIPFKDRKLE